MTAGIFAGLGFGAGAALLLAWAWPARPSLAASVARLRSSTATVPTTVEGGASWEMRLGTLAVAACKTVGIQFPRLRPDLAVLERSLEAQLARKALTALAGGLAAPAVAGLLAVAGLRISWSVPGWLAAGLALVGFWLPDQQLHSAAAARRRQMRAALGMLLNVVAVNLAGGAEVEEALYRGRRVVARHRSHPTLRRRAGAPAAADHHSHARLLAARDLGSV